MPVLSRDQKTWETIVAACDDTLTPEAFSDTLAFKVDAFGLPEFLPDLARLEWAQMVATSGGNTIPPEVDQLTLNPTLRLVRCSWKNLLSLITISRQKTSPGPVKAEELVLVWRDPGTGKAKMRAASNEDLLVLKMVDEGIDPRDVAAEGGLPVGAVDAAIDRAVERGILLAPRSRIRRDAVTFPKGRRIDERFFTASVFTLQWHITHACDLHCKHCYDRRNIASLDLPTALRILDDLRLFCCSKNVSGQVSFTGGNPLLHPHFPELYRAAAERGFSTAILGNPSSKERIRELNSIQPLSFFQVSLEGLEEHNDRIRGAGHFNRAMAFLDALRDLGIHSIVMLTLTNDNMDQVIPLAEVLRDRVDTFTFNRLSLVGEGAKLHPPDRKRFSTLLNEYAEAAKHNPVMGLKDNLINILHWQKGIELFGGCAGYGCSAAFNFISVLPDGEAHACRKFPSPIGNAREQGIAGVYESEIAQRYRAGCTECHSCAIRPVCGGCLAAAYSDERDVFKEKDPYCFIDMSS